MFEPLRILFKNEMPSRRLCVLFVLIVATFVNSSTVSAQSKFDIDTPGFLVDAMCGWGGMTDRSVPLPLAFHFRNDSDRNIVGQLIVSDKTSGYRVDLGEIVVAPGSTRRLTSIQKLTDWNEAVATLYGGGNIIWRRELALVTGNLFDPNFNYLLFVDDAGRRFQIPDDLAPENLPNRSNGQRTPAGTDGRVVRCVTVKPWQLANHPGPFIVAQAMVFSEGIAERDLNQTQWKAVAEWVCQGGAVFLPSTAREAIDRLIGLSPLNCDRESKEGPLAARRCGLGTIFEYTGAMMSTDGDALRAEIAQTVSGLIKNQINTFGDNRYFQSQGRSNTESKRNSLLIVGLFSAYTLLSGLVTLLLFRLHQKRIAAYITFVVVTTSICAVFLGGYLRLTKGDLRWVSITQASPGGLAQVGAIEVQSAGGRNALLTVTGEEVDLQFLGKSETSNAYWMQQSFGYSPFTWQPSLDPMDEKAYQIRVTMSPWGRRRCHATAFQRQSQQVEVNIRFEPSSSDPSRGHFSVDLDNEMPIAIKNCWLVIGVSKLDESGNPALPQGRQNRNRTNQSYQEVIDGYIDMYHTEHIGPLNQKTPRHAEFDSRFEPSGQNWSIAGIFPSGTQIPPRITQIGKRQAWLVGELSDSPIITIDEGRTDFIPSENTTHLFVQEIPIEKIPAVLDALEPQISAPSNPLEAQEGAPIDAVEPEDTTPLEPVSADSPVNN